MKTITTNLPGLKGIQVINSKPTMIYEGCSKPGKVPLIVKIINFFSHAK